ncbi:MAG: hypothetical protein ACOC93_05760, partial [Planctomycetota bacterium]
GKQAASYLVEVDGQMVTIVAAPVRVDSLEFGRRVRKSGQVFWVCRSGHCRMVSVQIGDHAYVAVGNQASHDQLMDVLTRISHDAGR